MTDAHANYRPDAPNEVSLHARISGLFRGVGPLAVLPEPAGFHTIAPAGAINASPQDMARWMAVQLNHGVLPDGSRLFSQAQADALWAPVVVVPSNEFKLPAGLSGMQPDMQAYALGWFVESYRGHIVVEHSGAVFGALAMQYLIPDKNVGISVTINSEDSFTRRAVMFHLLDQYLGLPPTDWIGKLTAAHTDMMAKTTAAIGALPKPAAATGASPALPLANYAGTYQDPWYGRMTVSPQPGGALAINFTETPGMSGALKPVSNNRFRTHWADRNIEDAFVDFATANGQVQSASLRAVSPLADFSFDYQDLHFARGG